MLQFCILAPVSLTPWRLQNVILNEGIECQVRVAKEAHASLGVSWRR